MIESLSLLFFMLIGISAPADDVPVDYVKHVAPILKTYCFDCHGADAQESGLRLDRRGNLLRGGGSGEPSIVPGDGGSSHLIQLVSGNDPKRIMPPEGDRLSADQIGWLKKWIDDGAIMPVELSGAEKLTTDHWSFQRVIRPDVPVVQAAANPVDAFVLDRLRQEGLKDSDAATAATRVRRLFLVMHGLPPAPEQLNAAVAKLSSGPEGAWEEMINEVLDSPRYGERWAQHWLDIIRFGETHGFETNRERPNAWHFRDYVIRSFNDDLPYDRFIREQIAGDALGADVATGYLVAGPHDLVKGQDPNLALMQRQDELSDLINVTGTTFMGLTLGCARCHNHKFDPITQRDFYSIQAVFAGVNHADRKLSLSAAAQGRLAAMHRNIAVLKRQLSEFEPKAAGSMVRPAVNSRINAENFETIPAKFVRFTIRATNGSQPCLDELEVWSGDRNIALASQGTKATSSSNLPGYEIHKLEHINDGKTGNSHSWISNEAGAGWVRLEFTAVTDIDRIQWGRDRSGRYKDRLATDYVIESSADGQEWTAIVSSADRLPFKGATPAEPVYDFASAAPGRARQGTAWLQELQTLTKESEQLAAATTVYAGTFSQPGPTHRLYRGEPLARREEVTPDTLEVMGSLQLERTSPEQQRRLRFAEWLTDPDNPLTARVIVNRLWQHHFGTGIVDTPNDFGKNGTAPSHPKLLDWLASELVSSGWSLKHIHRLILTSRTWQQSSIPRSDAVSVDAATRLLWRFPPRRLEAEAIRDSIVAVSGALNPKAGGPGFSGFEVEPENVRHFFPKTAYGPDDFRRMVYMTKVRQERESVFGAFDCPDASQVISKRSRSTTPLQALNLLNSSFVVQQSGLLSKRLKAQKESREEQIQLAYLLCFGRRAEADEASDAERFAEKFGLTSLCRGLLNSNEFLFIP
ncbi:MAG: DUF1553 domain-containing protein [Fuerstiella sp.]|jgi:hypothetical protein|nr:DUF1553 domain-containing protein [Fuerstiella sp.]